LLVINDFAGCFWKCSRISHYIFLQFN
jgi:hypothetical protein